MKHFLLCIQQGCAAGCQFYDVFESQSELFVHFVIIDLGTVYITAGSDVLLLVAGGVEPVRFDGVVQVLLLVLKVQFACQLVYLRFFYGTAVLAVTEDGDRNRYPALPFRFCFIWSKKVSEVPVMWLSPIPAVSLIVGR